MSYPRDTKIAEQETLLPSYQIDETQEELAVGGGGKRRCRGWFRRKCGDRPALTKAQRIKRVLKFFVVFTLLGGAFFAWFHPRHHPKVVFCKDVADDATSTEFTLPLFHKLHVLVHPSVNTGNSEIIRDDDVPVGKVLVTLEYAKPKEEDLLRETPEEGDDDDEHKSKTVVCAAVARRGVGFGLFTRHDHFTLPSVAKTTLKISSKAPAPSFIFVGQHRHWGHRFAHGCLQKMVRKWKNHQEEEERRAAE
jgi:hypothetical protein